MEFLSSARVGRERHILVLEGRAIPPAGRSPSTTAVCSYTYIQANYFSDLLLALSSTFSLNVISLTADCVNAFKNVLISSQCIWIVVV